jgi:hypothetical protein
MDKQEEEVIKVGVVRGMEEEIKVRAEEEEEEIKVRVVRREEEGTRGKVVKVKDEADNCYK